jgi:transcriptional regulator with XRE-family HTH domain
MSNTYELFSKIIESKGLTPYRVAKDTGLTTVLFTDWKKGKSKPKYDKLKVIADYLGVSVEYLQGIESKQQEILDILDGTDDERPLSAQEKTLVELFRGTTEEGRFEIIAAVMNIIKEKEKKVTTENTECVG